MPESGIYEIEVSEDAASAVPSNLDGDDLTDWVCELDFSETRSTYQIEARNHAGEALWTFDSGLNMLRMTHLRHIPLTVWDFDGDGIDEVITWKFGRTANPPIRVSIVVLDGRTGAIKSTTPLPWSGGAGNSRFNQGTTRSYATVAYLDGPDRPPAYCLQQGTYIDGVCWAFDYHEGRLIQRWAYQHAFHTGTGQHGLTAFDIDEDGRDDILMGGTVLDADGCKVFSWSDIAGYGHCDGAIPGDIDPTKPGVEILFHHEFGYGMALTSAEGEIYWHDDEVYHVHNSWVANVSEEHLGDEIRGRNKKNTWVLGFPEHLHDSDIDWDKLLNAQGEPIPVDDFNNSVRPPEWTGDELHDSWDRLYERYDLKVKPRKGGYTSQPVASDLGGGPLHGAEEILLINDGRLRVFFNQDATPYPSRWGNLNYRRMATSALGSGYVFWDTFRVWDVPRKPTLPTAYLSIDGRRSIGLRSQQTVDGKRVLKGKKFILLRDEAAQFRGTTSWDSDGQSIDSWHWDFGDGTRSTLADPIKAFFHDGTYRIKLTIEAGGEVSEEYATVEVQNEVFDYFSRIEHSIRPNGFEEGTRLYTDQDYVAESVPPALQGLTLIQPNYERESLRGGLLSSWNVTGIPMECISFRPADDMVVYLAMDEFRKDQLAPKRTWETEQNHYWPEWIDGDGWERTDLTVRNSRNGRAHQVYRKEYKAGDRVILGPNRYRKTSVGDFDRNMYFVLLSVIPPYEARSD